MKREALLIFGLTLALTLLGLLMVFSASYVKASSGHFIKAQLVYALVGFAGMAVAIRMDYRWLNAPALLVPLVLLSLGLLVLVLVPGFGVKVYGATRWLRIAGFQFQPSECAKLALVAGLAALLTRNEAHMHAFFRGFVPPMAFTLLFVGLVVLENDLGIPVIMLAVALMMICAAGAPWRYVFGLGLAALPAGAALTMRYPHRVARFAAFADPWEHADEASFQLIQSMKAFAGGGVLGRGAGASHQKLWFLPEPHSDFIFAIVGEELGLFGSLAVVAAYAALLLLALRVAAHARDRFGSLLAAGLIGLIAIQAGFVMAVTTGLAPTKGLPLPFISYGGTALIVFLTSVGLLLNVALQAPEPVEDRPLVRAAPAVEKAGRPCAS